MAGKNNPKFRLRTTKFFLTYPQLPKDVDLVELALSHFEIVFKMSRNDFKHVISVELHEDGNPHLHVYLEFNAPQKIYSQGKLDLTIDNKIYHGNYQSVKSKHSTIQYIIKSAESLDQVHRNMELPIYNGQYFTNMHNHLHEILIKEGRSKAVEILYGMYPKEAIQRGSNILRNLELADAYYESISKSEVFPKYTLADFSDLPEELREWLGDDQPTPLLLFGPTGVGKTELAKALMHHKGAKVIFIREKQGLKQFQKNLHTGIIFDDIDVGEWTREELIHLFDKDNDSQIRVLYGHVTLPAGLFKIFTTNIPAKFTRNDAALIRRLKPVEINEIRLINSPNPSSDAGSAQVGTTESLKDDKSLSFKDSKGVGDNNSNMFVDPYVHIEEYKRISGNNPRDDGDKLP